jgi:hypothetical protein
MMHRPRPRFLRLRLKSQVKIPRLNLRHSRRQDAKIKALSAQLRAKRARNGAPVEKKPIPVCTFCSKRGHNAVDCWDKLDADQAKLDVAKANRDKKKADMASAV